jgi:hypothetical protein
MKYWEVIADNLSKAGWSWGCVSALASRESNLWRDWRYHSGAYRARISVAAMMQNFSGLLTTL